MPDLVSFDGTKLAYEIEGEGPHVLLLHGFASDSYVNWVRPGLVDALVRAGFRAITLDQRGHGASGKPHEPDAYADEAMVRDARALLDELGLDECRVVGYSMGAWTALGLCLADRRPTAAVAGGIGGTTLRRFGKGREMLADALEAEDKHTITNRVGRSFRDFADLTGADRRALAALQRASWAPPGRLEDIRVPVLLICGDNDPLAGSPEEIADRIPDARVTVVGGTHLNVVNNAEFHEAVVGFLAKERQGG